MEVNKACPLAPLRVRFAPQNCPIGYAICIRVIRTIWKSTIFQFDMVSVLLNKSFNTVCKLLWVARADVNNDDYTLYSVNPDPRYVYPKKNEHNTLVIRGIVLGTVHSSDRASKEDRGILEDLFVDEIREFNEEHNLDGWE